MIQSALQTEVVVTSRAPLIETRTVQLSTNYSNELVKNIPTARNMLDLMESTPGVNDRGAYGAGGNVDSDYYQGSSTSAYLLNGVDVSDLDSGATWVNPNYDTIEEIQVVGVGASAEYGNFSGAVLNVITKAGSNAYHGGLSTYYSDSRLAGNNSGGVIDLNPDNIKYSPEIAGNFGRTYHQGEDVLFPCGRLYGPEIQEVRRRRLRNTATTALSRTIGLGAQR